MHCQTNYTKQKYANNTFQSIELSRKNILVPVYKLKSLKEKIKQIMKLYTLEYADITKMNFWLPDIKIQIVSFTRSIANVEDAAFGFER